MRASSGCLRPDRNPETSLMFAASFLAVFLATAVCFAQNSITPLASPSPTNATGVIRLRVRVKGGSATKGLPRKRFFLIKGSLEQNKNLIQQIEQRPVISRECYYRSVGASNELIKWLRDNDCETVYCREMDEQDTQGPDAVPEFQKALAVAEKDVAKRELARKWLGMSLPESIRDGFYRHRQEDLRALLKDAEDISGSKVLSVMTDTKGTAYFTELQPGIYLLSNMVPTEIGTGSISWHCEIQVKPGDLATEKPFLISNTGEKNVKCVGIEKPLPACALTQNRAP
jgi:hypothetical protein